MRTTRTPLLLLPAMALVAACSSSTNVGDKSGSAPGLVVLQMASTPAGPADIPVVDYFIKRVAALSHGRLTIKSRYQWGSYSNDAEIQVIKAVKTGDVDLGWAGSRAFDLLDDRAFQPLSAPFLIDNYALLQAVLTSPVPHRMLASLNDLGIHGLGLAADSLRLPIAVKAPLLTPQAWKGQAFGTYASEVQAETIQALGATPFVAFGPFRQQGLHDGKIGAFEFDLRRYGQLGLAPSAPYVVPNEVLWPQVDVIFVSPARMAGLTAQQRGWLSAAMQQTTMHAIAIARSVDSDVVSDCAQGAKMVPATRAQLATLRRAVDGVYAAIGHDSANARALAEIRQLKDATTPDPPRIPRSCLPTVTH